MIIFKQAPFILPQDSLRQITDTAGFQIISEPDTVRTSDTTKKNLITVSPQRIKEKKVDTISDGTSPVIIFHDTADFALENYYSEPFSFKNLSDNILITEDLREGEKPQQQALKDDWLIFIILSVSVLYIFISTIYNRLFSDMNKFFLFRGIGDPVSYDIQLLFNWKSTIINLVSFLNIALLLYCAADYYEFIPDVLHGIYFWLLCVTGTIIIISGRHIISVVTGKISGKTDLFNEYIITVYHSYRYMAIVFFIITVLILYTNILAVKVLLIAGFCSFVLTYLIRVLRLLLIFIRQKISIFYFILYLCALEILPVLVIIRYITGLF